MTLEPRTEEDDISDDEEFNAWQRRREDGDRMRGTLIVKALTS